MPKVLKRTACAKTLGFIVSLIWFIAIILSGQYANHQMITWGIFFWYPLVGAMIGLAGVMNKHPLLGKMWIWRGIMIAAFMNFVLLLFALDPLRELLSDMGYQFSATIMIWGAILEWAILGWAIDWYVTEKYGEGKKLMKK